MGSNSIAAFLLLVATAANASEGTFAKSGSLCFAVQAAGDCDLAQDSSNPDCLTHVVGTCAGELKAPSSFLYMRPKGSLITSDDLAYLSNPSCTWALMAGDSGLANVQQCKTITNGFFGEIFHDTFPPYGSLHSAMVGSASAYSAEAKKSLPIYVGIKSVFNMGSEAGTLKQSPFPFADVHQPIAVTEHRAPVSHLMCPDNSNKGPFSRAGQNCATSLLPGELMQTTFIYSPGQDQKVAMTNLRGMGLKASGTRMSFVMVGTFDDAKWKINGESVQDLGQKTPQTDIRNMSLQQPNGEGILFTFPNDVYYGELTSTGVQVPKGGPHPGDDLDQYHMFDSIGHLSKASTVRLHNIQADESGVSFDLDYIVFHAGEINGDTGHYAAYSPKITAISADFDKPVDEPVQTSTAPNPVDAPVQTSAAPNPVDKPNQSPTAPQEQPQTTPDASGPKGSSVPRSAGDSHTIVPLVATVFIVAGAAMASSVLN